MQQFGASTNDVVKLTIKSSHLELNRDQRRIRTKQGRSFVTNAVISDTQQNILSHIFFYMFYALYLSCMFYLFLGHTS